MTLGRVASHVAEIPQFAAVTLQTETLEMDPQHKPHLATSTAALLEKFDKDEAEARQLLATTSDEGMFKIWTLKIAGKAVFEMPRAGVLRSMVMNHMIHHRAQFGVYLRLLDVPVLDAYGPSAGDKTGFGAYKIGQAAAGLPFPSFPGLHHDVDAALEIGIVFDNDSRRFDVSHHVPVFPDRYLLLSVDVPVNGPLHHYLARSDVCVRPPVRPHRQLVVFQFEQPFHLAVDEQIFFAVDFSFDRYRLSDNRRSFRRRQGICRSLERLYRWRSCRCCLLFSIPHMFVSLSSTK